MFVGGILGILFVTMLRRVMVEDPELPFPESVAASEIHKAGQRGAEAAKLLFYAMGFGAVVYFLGAIKLFAASKDFVVRVGELGKSLVQLGQFGEARARWAPAASPAFRRRASARPTSASATSSGRGWRRSISPAACWPGACSFRC